VSPRDYWRLFRSGGTRLVWSFFREVHWFDLSRRTHTAGLVSPDQFGLTAVPHGTVVYMASWTSVIREQFAACAARLGPSFDTTSFIDVGCGKGKVLLVWAEQRDARRGDQAIIGVDFSPLLLAAARANVARRNVRNVTLVHSDILELPLGGIGERVILYLYNPFSANTLARVVDRFGDRIAAIVYCNPVHASTLLERGYEVVFETRGWHPNQRSLLLEPRRT
jgi:SAM-dependent methyltransferase